MVLKVLVILMLDQVTKPTMMEKPELDVPVADKEGGFVVNLDTIFYPIKIE